MLTFLEISTNFKKHWRWQMALGQCTYSSQLASQILVQILKLFQLLLSIKANLLEYLTSHKASIIFPDNAPNTHFPAFLEFLVNLLLATSHSKYVKHIYKSLMHLQKISSICCQVILDLVNDSKDLTSLMIVTDNDFVCSFQIFTRNFSASLASTPKNGKYEDRRL